MFVCFNKFLVQIMRKNLLKYVRVREFAPEAEFQNHSLGFSLPNVICRYKIVGMSKCRNKLLFWFYCTVMYCS